MISSMTGYGVADRNEDGVAYSVEIKSLNHRYLKLSLRLPDGLQHCEQAVERVLRARLSRGSVAVSVRTRGGDTPTSGAINLVALQHYADELLKVALPEGVQPTIDLGSVAALPGVCEPADADESTKERQIALMERLVADGLAVLLEMRCAEGKALHDDMMEACRLLRGEMVVIEQHAPHVLEEYHERLKSRVAMLMKKGGYELEADGLMREVAIYAERCDIGEELTRLAAHLDQFAELCQRSEPVGRTLDFLAQELLREANTISSKSNNARIARSVVTIKGLVDRLKEQVQNVE